MVELPEDVLIQVFQHLTHSCFIHSTPAAHPSSWFRTALVCRYWRNIVINTPSLWSHIEWTRNPNWVQLCISKSKNLQTPLWISLDLPHRRSIVGSDLSSAKDVFALLPRAHHLTLGGEPAILKHLQSPNSVDTETMEQGDALSAPQLQSVELVNCHYLGDIHPLLSFLSRSKFPSLAHLRAVGWDVLTIKPFLRPTITHLSIRSGEENVAYPATTISQFISQIAETTPALQELVLEFTAFFGSHAIGTGSPRLPNTLKRMRLSMPGGQIQMQKVLEQLSVPPSVRFFELNLHGLKNGQDTLRFLTARRRIAGWLRSGGFFPQLSPSVGVALESDEKRCVVKVCRESGVDGDGNRGDEAGTSWWTVSFEDGHAAYLDIIPFDLVTSLELKASSDQVKSFLPSLRKMDGVRFLRYVIGDEGSIEGIFQLFPEEKETHSGPLIFSCLSHLELSFPCSSIHDNTGQRRKVRRQSMDRLYRSIRRRIDAETVRTAKSGTGLDINKFTRVSFRGCPGSGLGLGEEELVWLRDALPKVQVRWGTAGSSMSATS